MNLVIFLKEVDRCSSTLSRSQLEGFIHEIARTLPEWERDQFLKILKTYGGIEGDVCPQTFDDIGCTEILTKIAAVKEKLLEINRRERYLDSEYNPEWDDWYNREEEEVLFRDSQGVLKDIAEAVNLMHRCMDMMLYKEGCELAEILSVLEIHAEGDYDDYSREPLNLCGLNDYHLLECDFKKMVTEVLYLTYMGNELEHRADELVCMIRNFECYDIRLENILQSGQNELPQFDEFLALWISYLGVQKENFARRLLLEAQGMLRDEEVMLENAIRFAEVHPVLFKQLLEMKRDSGENEKMLKIGMEALERVSQSCVVRSEIALLSAEYACKLQDAESVEKCWLEAFCSYSSVLNYLRLRFETRDWSRYMDRVKAIYKQIYLKTKDKSSNRIYEEDGNEKNSLYKNEYCIMLFFDEQFDQVLSEGMNEKRPLGWTMTFMKQGLAFFLLLLYAGKEPPVGLKHMLNTAALACGFKAEEYFRGTGKDVKKDDQNTFWELFCRWKETLVISEEEKTQWMDKIDGWIAGRVAGIMDANRRNYYGECAAYIAAFGEVQESRGIPYAKDRIMERYRSEYSRRRAFHQELRLFGMRK